jgi:hypothetical protein
MMRTYKKLDTLKFSNGRQNPLYEYITKHKLKLKSTDLKTSNWYYCSGAFFGIELKLAHRMEIKTKIAHRLGKFVTKEELLLLQTELQNNCDLDMSDTLEKTDLQKIFELTPSIFTMRDPTRLHSAKAMELSCPGYILEPFRNLCIRALPDSISNQSRYGFYMPSNITKLMDTKEEGKTANITNIIQHNKQVAKQTSFNVFYIPNINQEVTDDDGTSTTIREWLMDVNDALALYTNDHTDIPGHYRIIIPDEENLDQCRECTESVLKKIFSDDKSYNKEWGCPSIYKTWQQDQNATLAQPTVSSFKLRQKQMIRDAVTRAQEELKASKASKSTSNPTISKGPSKQHTEIKPKSAWTKPLHTKQLPAITEATEDEDEVQIIPNKSLLAFPDEQEDDNDSKYKQVLEWSNNGQKERFIQKMTQALGIDKLQEENQALRSQIEAQEKNWRTR